MDVRAGQTRPKPSSQQHHAPAESWCSLAPPQLPQDSCEYRGCALRSCLAALENPSMRWGSSTVPGLRLTLGVLTASGKSGKIAADARDTQRRSGPTSKSDGPG